MDNITKIIKEEIAKCFLRKNIENIKLSHNFPKDLKIYGDDFEELIFDLAEKLDFSWEEFGEIFEKEGFTYFSEFYIPLLPD